MLSQRSKLNTIVNGFASRGHITTTFYLPTCLRMHIGAQPSTQYLGTSHVSFDKQHRCTGVIRQQVSRLLGTTGNHLRNLGFRVAQELEDPIFQEGVDRLTVLFSPGKGRVGALTCDVRHVFLHFTGTAYRGFSVIYSDGCIQALDGLGLNFDQMLQNRLERFRVFEIIKTQWRCHQNADEVLTNIIRRGHILADVSKVAKLATFLQGHHRSSLILSEVISTLKYVFSQIGHSSRSSMRCGTIV